MAFGEPSAGEWRAVAPLRKGGLINGRKELRAGAAAAAVALGLVAVLVFVSQGGNSISAASLEQADAGLIAQQAVTTGAVQPKTEVVAAVIPQAVASPSATTEVVAALPAATIAPVQAAVAPSQTAVAQSQTAVAPTQSTAAAPAAIVPAQPAVVATQSTAAAPAAVVPAQPAVVAPAPTAATQVVAQAPASVAPEVAVAPASTQATAAVPAVTEVVPTAATTTQAVAAPAVASTVESVPAATAAAAQVTASSTSLDAAQQADLTREIKELEQQETLHFAARHKALEAAVKATSNCPPTDTACQQAAQHVNWKMSKDQYEQAAMQDIMKQDKTKTDSSAGMAIFESYSKLADALSGVPQLKSLYNETKMEEKSREQKEHDALNALKAADSELRQLEDIKRKLRHAEQEKKQLNANAAAQKSLQEELQRSTSDQDSDEKMFKEAKEQDTKRQAVEKTTLQQYRAARTQASASAKEVTFIDSSPYSADYQAAKQGEAARRTAFKEYVAKLHQQDMVARAERAKILSEERAVTSSVGEKKEATTVQGLSVVAAKDSSEHEYARDVNQALRVDALRQAQEEKAIQAAKAQEAKRAEVRQASSNQEVLSDAKQAAAVMGISGGSSSNNDFSDKAYEASVAEARKREIERVGREQEERAKFRESRAKILAKDDATRLSQMQRYMEETAANIVSHSDVSIARGNGRAAEVKAIVGGK